MKRRGFRRRLRRRSERAGLEDDHRPRTQCNDTHKRGGRAGAEHARPQLGQMRGGPLKHTGQRDRYQDRVRKRDDVQELRAFAEELPSGHVDVHPIVDTPEWGVVGLGKECEEQRGDRQPQHLGSHPARKEWRERKQRQDHVGRIQWRLNKLRRRAAGPEGVDTREAVAERQHVEVGRLRNRKPNATVIRQQWQQPVRLDPR